MTIALTLVLTGALPAAASGGGWTWPIEPPVVVHDFDPPDGPYGPGHRGVDLAGEVGEPVLAAGAGVVAYAGRVAGVGVVTIRHGAMATTYQPLETWVAIGTVVGGGDPIGTLALLGSHCSIACLHWGAIADDDYIDPLSLIRPGPSRLLPYWQVGSDARGGSLGASTGGGLLAGSAGDGVFAGSTGASRGATAADASPRPGATRTPGAPADTSPRPTAAATVGARGGSFVPGAAAADLAKAADSHAPPRGVAAGIALGGGLLAAGGVLMVMRRRR